jgi:hypothetical protein
MSSNADESVAWVREHYAELKKRVEALIQSRRDLTARVRSLTAAQYASIGAPVKVTLEEELAQIGKERKLTVTETGRCFRDLFSLLVGLEAIDLVRAARLQRAHNAFLVLERPISRTEYDWETDRAVKLSALLHRAERRFPEIEGHGAEPRVKSKSPPSRIHIPGGTNWSDVTIGFIDEHSVQIEVAGDRYTRGYEDAGFSDRRTSKPNHAWAMLRVFAEKGALRRPDATKGISKLEKTVSDLRKRLRTLIPIDGNPIEFGESKSYRVTFTLRAAK